MQRLGSKEALLFALLKSAGLCKGCGSGKYEYCLSVYLLTKMRMNDMNVMNNIT